MSADGRYQADIEPVSGGHRVILAEHGHRLSFARYLELLENEERFRHWYTRLLVDSGPAGFFWEHPPITADRLGDTCQFVLIESLFLTSLAAERAPFEAHFRANPDKRVIAFDNLGGDALLIVPTPVGPDDVYPHFARFLRNAPTGQIDALWRETANQARKVIGPSPRWLSTAGLGVSWVHLRLDTRPKYYRYGPYKQDMRFDPI